MEKTDIVPVKIHKIQQQTNSVDCGVFAIAFMTEFCFSGWNGKNSIHFDTNVMRNHLLIKCMEDKQFSPFSKIKPVKSKVTLNMKNTSVNLSIKKECKAECDLPNLFEDMVSCDKCSTWYHFDCASNGTLVNFQGSFSFTCNNCSSV